MAGSSDLFEHQGRRPRSNVNFVTVHDGFTLTDLVSYDKKHKRSQPRGQSRRDQRQLSWNCGVEGPADDPPIRHAARTAETESVSATLLLSLGRSADPGRRRNRADPARQHNAYCQDNKSRG